MEQLTILIADDHSIIHVGISTLIKKIKPRAIIHIAEDFPSVIKMVKKHSFNLVIMDINMPAGNFQSTLNIIKQQQPKVKVMAFSSADEKLFAPRFVLQGADGFLNKLSSEEQVQNAIESILDTGSYLSQEIKDDILQNVLKINNPYQNPLVILTNREIEIANLLIQGSPLKEISSKLFIHVSTVSTYKTRIFNKLSIQTTPELIELFRTYNSQ